MGVKNVRSYSAFLVVIMAVALLLVGCSNQTGSQSQTQSQQTTGSSTRTNQAQNNIQIKQGACESKCNASVTQTQSNSGASSQASGGQTAGGSTTNDGNQGSSSKIDTGVDVKGLGGGKK